MNAPIALALSITGQLAMTAVLAREAVSSPLCVAYRLKCGLGALLFLAFAILLIFILLNSYCSSTEAAETS